MDMERFEEKEYRVFEMFQKQWALVTAGNIDDFNGCTVGWGSMGTIWNRDGKSGAILTIYLHPSRYTREYFNKNDTFTVAFFPEDKKGALGYMGSHSGRNEDKTKGAGLTPVAMGDSVTYKEAELTFLCHKIYQHQLAKEDMAEEIQEYYKDNPKAYPPDENGEWQPHWLFIGEVIEAEDKR